MRKSIAVAGFILALFGGTVCGWFAALRWSEQRFVIVNTSGNPVRIDRQTGRSWVLYRSNPPRWVEVAEPNDFDKFDADEYLKTPRR